MFLVTTWAHEYFEDDTKSPSTFAKNLQQIFFPYPSLHLQEIKMLTMMYFTISQIPGGLHDPRSWRVQCTKQEMERCHHFATL